MLKIKEKTKIFVVCEPKYATGGTEALHQLVDKLRKLGHDAYIYYTSKVDNPTPETFKNYKINISEKIEDDASNLVITTEGRISFLKSFKNLQKSIWWLSIDNVEKNTSNIGQNLNSRFSKLKNIPGVITMYRVINKHGKWAFDFNSDKNKEIIHFTQSKYAEYFLLNKGAKEVYMLSDYLNRNFFVKNKVKVKKQDIVVYNPKKGAEITSKLINANQNIKWVPIQNMTPLQVSNLLESSKIYIDFGDHPGKDRIPREAAIKGCCIIVGKRGSANFNSDITIPEEYKFVTYPLDIESIINKIKECLEDYESKNKDFDTYRRIIALNEEQFEVEIKQIFGIK